MCNRTRRYGWQPVRTDRSSRSTGMAVYSGLYAMDRAEGTGSLSNPTTWSWIRKAICIRATRVLAGSRKWSRRGSDKPAVDRVDPRTTWLLRLDLFNADAALLGCAEFFQQRDGARMREL